MLNPETIGFIAHCPRCEGDRFIVLTLRTGGQCAVCLLQVSRPEDAVLRTLGRFREEATQ